MHCGCRQFRRQQKRVTWLDYQALEPETHTNRQATQHDCLPLLLGDGDTGFEIVYDEEQNSLYCGPTRAAEADQKYLVRPARQAQ